MSNIIVLPRVEIDNPFGALATALEHQVIPFVKTLTENKDKIATLSDKELTDYIPILKQYAPDLLTKDGKIDWNKVDEYAKSDDQFKQQIAEHLTNAKKLREEYANFPIGMKVGRLDEYLTATDPQRLKKHFVINRVVEKFNEYINKANLSEEDKLFLRAHALELAEKAVENPAYFTAFLKLFEQRQQGATQQGGGNTQQGSEASSSGGWKFSLDGKEGWKFSLDGKEGWKIRLEEPQLTVPQITPPQIPASGGEAGHKHAVRHVAERRVKQSNSSQAPKQQAQSSKQDEIPEAFWYKGLLWIREKDGSLRYLNPKKDKLPNAYWQDGVLWVRGKDGKYHLKREAPLIEQDIDPLTAMLGGALPKLFAKGGGGGGGSVSKALSKVFGKGGGGGGGGGGSIGGAVSRVIGKSGGGSSEGNTIRKLPNEGLKENVVEGKVIGSFPQPAKTTPPAVGEYDVIKTSPINSSVPQTVRRNLISIGRRVKNLIDEAPEHIRNTPQFKELIKEIIENGKEIHSKALKGGDVSKSLAKLNKAVEKLENIVKASKKKVSKKGSSSQKGKASKPKKKKSSE